MPLTPKSIMSTGPQLPFQRQKEVLASGKPQMSTMPLSSSLASKPLQPTQSGLTGSRTVILNFLTYGMQRTLSMAPAFGRKFVIWLTTFIKGAPGSSVMVRKLTSGTTPGLKENPYLFVSLFCISPWIKDYPSYTNQSPSTSLLTFHLKFSSSSLLSFQTSPPMLKTVILSDGETTRTVSSPCVQLGRSSEAEQTSSPGPS